MCMEHRQASPGVAFSQPKNPSEMKCTCKFSMSCGGGGGSCVFGVGRGAAEVWDIGPELVWYMCAVIMMPESATF